MPTILTPQGWVKVAPAPRRKKPVKSDPAVALKGPLAYFSCQPLPPSKKTTNRPQYPYDLSASPEKLERQSKNHARMGGNSRTVSAPHPNVHVYDYSDQEDIRGRQSESSGSTRSVTPPPRSPRSHRPSRSQRHEHHYSHSPGATAPSTRSYTRHRPVEPAPRPTSAYHPPPHGGPLNHSPYDNYPAPGSFERPPPPTNARSMSYSWYNATTPLNL